MSDLIVTIVTALVKVVNVSRAALAADLHDIADKVAAGSLIPDEAFAQAKSTRDDTKNVYDNLPE